MKVLLMLGYLLWEGVQREVEWNKTQQPTETYIVCWLDPIVECKTLVFSQQWTSYICFYIYTYYIPQGSILASPVHCATYLVSIFPLFCLVRLSQVMLSQLKTKFSLDEIQRGYAEEVREALLREHQKSTWTNRKPCCALQVLRPGLWVPAEQPGPNCSQMAGGRAVRSPGPRQPQDPPPSKPKFGDTVGIFFKKYLLTVLFDFL